MSFWFRYSVLILLCVVTPLGLGFWVDTQSQLERAKAAGEASAMAAEPALSAQLTLAAHQRVGQALQLAQNIGDEKLLVALKGDPKLEAPARIKAILAADQLSEGGFVWVLDEMGAVASQRGTAREHDPDHLTGHPLFVATQLGFALDGTLRLGDALFVVGAAPIAREGEAQGAVFVARPVDRALVAELAATIRVEVTLLQKDEVVASTLPTDVAANVVSTLDASISGPTHGGRLATPLSGTSWAGFLPLFVAHDASGIAYSSLMHAMVGQDDSRWVISVENGRALANLAERQQSIVGILVAALLCAIVIGLSLSRTFVRPISQLTDHLSGLQQGRGEREISESQVSRPYRRLAKLINMTVQRIPPGGVFGFETGERRPSADPQAPDLGAAMLSGAPSVPAEQGLGVPQPLAGAAPISISALGSSTGARTGSGAARSAERSQIEPLSPSAPSAPAPSATPARAPSFTPSRAESSFAEVSVGDLVGSMAAPDLDHALAAAARAVDTDFEPVAQQPAASRRPRSASSIRGAPSTNVSQSMLDMNTQMFQTLGAAVRAESVARPDLARPETIRPDTARPEMARPETVRPDTVRPDRGPYGGGEASSPFMGLLDDAKSPPATFATPSAIAGTSRMGGSAAFGLGSAGVPEEDDEGHSDDFKSEATIVAAPNDFLLKASARDVTASGFAFANKGAPDRTLVAEVPKDLIAESKKPSVDIDDPEDIAHFKETYERFVDMRRQCGEPTGDLVFERFVAKLRKNREGLISKYNCRTVRFQVYEKDGKAALKATPVRV